MTNEQAVKWVKFVHDVLYEDKDEEIREALDMAIEALQDRPKGEWIEKEIPCNPYPPVFCVECSECGYRVGRETFQENTFTFCPNCGSIMEK